MYWQIKQHLEQKLWRLKILWKYWSTLSLLCWFQFLLLVTAYSQLNYWKLKIQEYQGWPESMSKFSLSLMMQLSVTPCWCCTQCSLAEPPACVVAPHFHPHAALGPLPQAIGCQCCCVLSPLLSTRFCQTSLLLNSCKSPEGRGGIGGGWSGIGSMLGKYLEENSGKFF